MIRIEQGFDRLLAEAVRAHRSAAGAGVDVDALITFGRNVAAAVVTDLTGWPNPAAGWVNVPGYGTRERPVDHALRTVGVDQ